MIWLTWRQFRLNVAVISAALLALAVVFAVTGPDLAEAYNERLATFPASINWAAYIAGTAAGLAVPALVGVFWGAPMVARELEAGTHRLVWTQSVTRRRWLVAKLALGMVGAVVAGAVIGLAMTWWAGPIDSFINGQDPGNLVNQARILPGLFESRGIAPIGYAALTFALGVFVGAVIKRTVPAMAVTLVVFVALHVAMTAWIRPHLVEPAQTTVAITDDNFRSLTLDTDEWLNVDSPSPGAWLLSQQTLDSNGQAVNAAPAWLRDAPRDLDAILDRLSVEGYQVRVTYHPASHYWALQWRETAILAAGALALVGASIWWVRRLS